MIGFENNDHTILNDAHVVYENDKILYVGHDYPLPVDHQISAGEAILSPGFIDLNALGDIDHDILHFQADEQIAKGLVWSEEYLKKGPRSVLNPQEDCLKNRYAFAQLIRNGVTTAMPITSVLHSQWTRSYKELEQAAHIAGELGLRVYLGPSYQSGVRVARADGSWFVSWQPEKGEIGLQQAVDFVRQFDGAYQGLIKGFLAPERIETITPELLKQSKHFSDQLDCPIRLHAAQGAFEYQEIFQRHDLSPIAFLESINFLGSRTLIPHAIYTSGSRYVSEKGDADLERLVAFQTSVIQCPLVMARHGMALDTFDRYKRIGVNLTMGSDTFPPDMIENMRTGSYLAKVMEGDPSAGSASDFFRAATLGGARALGRDDLGRLAPGAKADMIIIDLADFHVGQIDDPIKTMILSTSGADVKTSIINGEVVMRDRQLPGIDLNYLHQAAQACFLKIKSAYSERDYLQRSPEKLFPSSFPIDERRPVQPE